MYSKDFRDHLMESIQTSQSAIMAALVEPLETESLELIVLSVKFRPEDSLGQTVIDPFTRMERAQGEMKERSGYLLCLIPKEWGEEGIRIPLLKLCSTLQCQDVGCIKTWIDFENCI
ncbi:uncharacterized protein BP01DRAFT_362541 [Aspergillus saccharolyticus JOP 1030-1]|uniref:Uncharacterized protein n=1 Tax=Aspergillus saccharolyticus JOP 1030-1 TaxID=1450539 RepID=A0A318ZQH9_9EURO|nr:hypothetical protein BP01DRAFT_362541 [Aspergillus saccharolyticus JOP 1030-1]PYH48804.1 hypothetical protein BP01DRAFT_362541 [Aspergillus saccharolyticus JOP 1030-1]